MAKIRNVPHNYFLYISIKKHTYKRKKVREENIDSTQSIKMKTPNSISIGNSKETYNRKQFYVYLLYILLFVYLSIVGDG